MPLVHERKELSHLRRFDFHVAHFVDHQAVIRQIAFEDLFLAAVRQRLEELVDQLRERHEVAPMTPIDRLQQEGGGQPGFAASGGSQPDDVAMFAHVVELIVQ